MESEAPPETGPGPTAVRPPLCRLPQEPPSAGGGAPAPGGGQIKGEAEGHRRRSENSPNKARDAERERAPLQPRARSPPPPLKPTKGGFPPQPPPHYASFGRPGGGRERTSSRLGRPSSLTRNAAAPSPSPGGSGPWVRAA